MPNPAIKRSIHRYEKQWFSLLFRLQGSVIPAIIPRTLLCCVFSVAVLLLHGRGWPVSSPALGSLVPGLGRSPQPVSAAPVLDSITPDWSVGAEPIDKRA